MTEPAGAWRLGDVLLRGGHVVPMTGAEDDGAADVLVRDGRIEAVGPGLAAPDGVPVVDVEGCAVLPGFVQAHTHLGQALFRGLAEDRPLLSWLRDRIWPLEAAHDERTAYASARLCLLDAVASGTTTVQDMGLVRHTEALARACEEAGIRTLLGPCLMDGGDPHLATGTDEALAAAEAFVTREGRRWVRPLLCPRFALSCSEALWRGVVALAQRHGVGVHTHLLEHPSEEPAVEAAYGVGQMALLDRLGVLDTDLRVAHCVQLGPAEARVVGDRPLKIAHCPSANLKLGSGIADLRFLGGLPGAALGIGCDGAPCNNDMDVLEEVRLAALLQQHRQGPGRFSAYDALRLATCDGARAVGLAGEIGTVEPGKWADLVVLDLSSARTFGPPPVGIYDRIVYTAGRECVRHVFVAGTARVRDGVVTFADPGETMRRAAGAFRAVVHRAGIA